MKNLNFRSVGINILSLFFMASSAFIAFSFVPHKKSSIVGGIKYNETINTMHHIDPNNFARLHEFEKVGLKAVAEQRQAETTLDANNTISTTIVRTYAHKEWMIIPASIADSSNIWLSQVSVANGVPVYLNAYHFRKVALVLNQRYDLHNSQFEAEHQNLSDESYNNLIQSIEFDEEKPLSDFENSKNFVSQRRYVADIMSAWLDNPLEETDPQKGKVDNVVLASMINPMDIFVIDNVQDTFVSIN